MDIKVERLAVSVLLPVYNGAPWLAGAIHCVLEQTMPDFELIIIDDGSTDNSWAVISGFDDHRIRAFRQENAGLAATLNIGLRLANAQYVARQDQDDWMHPERLGRQLLFMQANPDCAAVGTWAEIRADDRPSERFHRHPLGNDALRLFLLFDNPFVHSSMLLRRDAVLSVGGYSEDRSRQPPEDYELWSRLARVFKVANIDENLTAYREVAGSMSRVGVSPFQRNVLKISAENIYEALGRRYKLEQCHALSVLYHGVTIETGARLSVWSAFSMLDQATLALVGHKAALSGECFDVYIKMRGLLISRMLSRYVPLRVLGVLRRIKRLVMGES